jgi:glycosyltransferase involved in cell wall biosynthesis
MPTPLVTIIIPNFNSGPFLHETLLSVLWQTYQNFEVIVVDDGSTDESWKVAESLGRIQVIRKRNEGAPKARNVGLDAAKGEFVKFLDADDILMPAAIAHQVDKAMTLAEDEIPYGLVAWFGTKGRGFANRVVRPGVLADMIDVNIMTSSTLIRRAHAVEVGGYDTRIRRAQEWNFHVRLAARGTHFIYHPVEVYLYRKHASKYRISTQNAPVLAGRQTEKLSITFDQVKGQLDIGARIAYGRRVLQILRRPDVLPGDKNWRILLDLLRQLDIRQDPLTSWNLMRTLSSKLGIERYELLRHKVRGFMHRTAA